MPSVKRRWNGAAADVTVAIALLFLSAILIAPLFTIEYLDNWGSIDSTFIADSRFLAEHWPRPLWQPLWYCGTRFDYIYPPALRYGAAGLARVTGISTARAYHVYTGFLYCLGIAGVYLLARTLRFRRIWACIAAAAVAVLSPSFLLMASYRHDAALHMPQRLNVLVKWGEGPHVSALSLLPFALLFTLHALRRGKPSLIVLAAVFSTLVVAHNFYGAVALAICFGLAVWSVWVAQQDRAVFTRAALVALLAYGLAAWWLTPSYIRITIDNLKLVAQPGNSWSRSIAGAALIAFGWLSWRLARGSKSSAVFVCGAALFFSLIVIGHYYAGFRVVGEPHRFVPELDLMLILGTVALLQRLADAGGARLRIATAVAVVAAFAACYPYLARPWSVFVADSRFRERTEYRMSEWLARRLPGARVFVTGSLRFWYDAWHDGAQVGGGSEQGLLNGTMALAQWQVIRDASPGRDVAWLQAVGADAVVVHEPPSGVVFFEYPAPRKFAGVLPVIFDDGAGNLVYRVPRRFAARARVVETKEVERLRPIPVSDENRGELEAYVRAVERGPDRRIELRRDGPEAMTIRAGLHEGESLLVQESYDPAWHAYSGGRSLPVSRDVAGFLLVHAPPGEHDIRLAFELPFEDKAGRVVSLISVLASVGFLWSRRKKNQPLLPGVTIDSA